jgi:hypothetical protein
MDNFFEILIYLIIIISIVSSFVKKKQKPQESSEQKPQRENYTQADTSVTPAQPKEEYDILKEIEDFFKVETNEPVAETTVAVKVEPQKKMTEIEKQVKDESWHSPTKSEHEFTDDWEKKKEEIKKKIARVDSGIEKQAAKFEELLHMQETVPNQLALLVKSKLVNPSTLKEYIIFSEILGKPKALRR